MIEIQFKNTLNDGMKRYFTKVGIGKISIGAHKKAMAKTGIQLLNWILNGSARESVVPPIKDTVLRGSGSVFVGSEVIHTSRGLYSKGNPNTSHTDNKDTITVGFDTAYAATQHERLKPAGTWKPGPRSQQAGNVGGKFVERHIIADGNDLIALYATFLKKESGG